MRIIAGDWKGRRLKAVEGMKTRPTSDKVKGAIFNILGNKTADAKVLDLFAGTGGLALEALSRGAASAVLVEKSHSAWEIINENIAMVGAQDRIRLLKMDGFQFLKQSSEKYDLIFLDPPYHQGIIPKVIIELDHYQLLNRNGVIIVETAADEEIDKNLFPFEIMITKQYGDTKLWFLQETEGQGEV